MSEPVTNAEIEDVLSAVRRLVSETGAVRNGSDTDVTGKLVLTPAFRVDPVEDDHAPEHGQTAPAEPAQPSPVAPETSVEALVQDAVEAGPATGHDDMHEWDDDPADMVEDAQPASHAKDNVTELRTSLADRIAELEAVVVETGPDDFEPDGSEASDVPDEVLFHHARDGADGVDGAEASDAENGDVAVSGDDAPTEETPSDDPVSDEWEDVVSVDLDGFDDDALDDPLDAADTTLEGSDYAAHKQNFDAFGPDTYADPDDTALDEEADEMVIDEAMLREIVARLVRDELQGTMGERITRNLRRMVRREIARALALKDLD